MQKYYVVFIGHNGNHAFFHDPWYGAQTAHLISKFMSPNQKYPFFRWKIKGEEFLKYMDEDFSA